MKDERLLSIDALRGFDMLFIMGGAALLVALAEWFPCSFTQALAEQMDHVEWHGLRHHDTIFPLFLFIAGISFPFSLAKQRQKGRSAWAIHRKVIVRGLMLVFLGVVYNGLLDFDFENLRYASVLGRIGLAWMFAALIFIHTGWKARVGITALLLVGYWLVAGFIPAPDGGGEDIFSAQGSIVGYVDRILLPGRIYYGNIDPEGILSVVPAIGTALLGMFTGELVKKRSKEQGAGGKNHHAGNRFALERSVPHQQEDVDKFVRAGRWRLFCADVRPLLLYNRCIAVAPVDVLLHSDWHELHHHLPCPEVHQVLLYV